MLPQPRGHPCPKLDQIHRPPQPFHQLLAQQRQVEQAQSGGRANSIHDIHVATGRGLSPRDRAEAPQSLQLIHLSPLSKKDSPLLQHLFPVYGLSAHVHLITSAQSEFCHLHLHITTSFKGVNGQGPKALAHVYPIVQRTLLGMDHVPEIPAHNGPAPAHRSHG